jgi:phospholipid N-methyltransferase
VASIFDPAQAASTRAFRGPQPLLFARTFLRHPNMVGSAFPASRWMVERMLAPVDLSATRLFVEYGPGTGVFTRAVLDRLPARAIMLAVDTSRDFVAHLQMTLPDPRLRAVHGSAVDIARLLQDMRLPPADYILSGLPFSTVGDAQAEAIMAASRDALAPEGEFLAYQMRTAIRPLLERHIGPVHADFEWRNIPPCHLYRARKCPP